MVQVPAFPAWAPAPPRRHWAVAVLAVVAFAARVFGWLLLAAAVTAVLVAVVALCAFAPFLRGSRTRRW